MEKGREGEGVLLPFLSFDFTPHPQGACAYTGRFTLPIVLLFLLVALFLVCLFFFSFLVFPAKYGSFFLPCLKGTRRVSLGVCRREEEG